MSCERRNVAEKAQKIDEKKFYKRHVLSGINDCRRYFSCGVRRHFNQLSACLELNQLSKNTSIAIHASKARLETIRNTAFNLIKATYDNVTFTTPGLNGTGTSYVDDSNPRLLKITVSFSWQQSNGRAVGPISLVTHVFQ